MNVGEEKALKIVASREEQGSEGNMDKGRKGKEKTVTVVPFSLLSEVDSKNWKQWRSLISHHLHRVHSESDKLSCNLELYHTHTDLNIKGSSC